MKRVPNITKADQPALFAGSYIKQANSILQQQSS
jgi:hypothetical protein